jgi:hypothetical protein
MEVSGQFYVSVAVPAGTIYSGHWVGGWVGPRAGLDVSAKRSCLFKRNCKRSIAWHRTFEVLFWHLTVIVKLLTKCLYVGMRRRSRWPRRLRREYAVARLPGLRVSNPCGEHGCFVCCDCCALSGRGLCDELITRPEESYRLRSVWILILKPRHWGGLGPLGGD